MGKRIISRKRGAGSPRYRSPGHRFIGKPAFPAHGVNGVITNIVHAPGRKTPVAIAKFSGEEQLLVAS